MGTEVPLWIGGLQKWVTGVTKQTTCEDIIRAVLASNEDGKSNHGKTKKDVKSYTIVERWHRVERPLDSKSRLLKVWNTWGLEQCNVRFLLRKCHPPTPKDVKGHHKQRRQGKINITKSAKTWHPKKLRSESEDDYLDDEDFPATAEQLKNLISSQEDALSSQVRHLQEKDEEIEYIENQIHLQRMHQIGVNYVQDTYLADSSESENCSSGSSIGGAIATEESCDMLDHCIELYEKVLNLCDKVREEEGCIRDLTAKLKQTVCLRDRDHPCDPTECGDAEHICVTPPERVEEMLNRTRHDIERLLKVNETQQLTINQNERTLSECTKLIEEKHYYLQHLKLDLDRLDQDNAKLQEDFAALQAASVSVESTPSTCCETVESTDSNSDTGISSLHSSSDDGAGTLDTLV